MTQNPFASFIPQPNNLFSGLRNPTHAYQFNPYNLLALPLNVFNN